MCITLILRYVCVFNKLGCETLFPFTLNIIIEISSLLDCELYVESHKLQNTVSLVRNCEGFVEVTDRLRDLSQRLVEQLLCLEGHEGVALEALCLVPAFCSLPLYPCCASWPFRTDQLCFAMPFFHLAPALEPDDQGLNLLKP